MKIPPALASYHIFMLGLHSFRGRQLCVVPILVMFGTHFQNCWLVLVLATTIPQTSKLHSEALLVACVTNFALTRLRPQILEKVGHDVPKRYTASLVLVSMLPFLSRLIWTIGEGPGESLQGLDYATWLTRKILQSLQPCLALSFALKFSQRLLKLRKMPLFRGRLICLSICLSPVMCSCVGFVWASFDVTKAMSPQNSWLPLVPFLLAIALNIVVYCF